MNATATILVVCPQVCTPIFRIFGTFCLVVYTQVCTLNFCIFVSSSIFNMSKPKMRLQTAAVSNDSPAQEMSDNAYGIEEASADESPVHINQPFPHRSPPPEVTAELQQPGMPSRPNWVTGFEFAIKHDIAQQLDGIKAIQRATNAQLASFLDQHQHLEAEVVALSHRIRNPEQPQPHVTVPWFPNMAGIDDATIPAPSVASVSQSRQDVRTTRGRPADNDFYSQRVNMPDNGQVAPLLIKATHVNHTVPPSTVTNPIHSTVPHATSTGMSAWRSLMAIWTNGKTGRTSL